jgi:putative ABC transport system permease protein
MQTLWQDVRYALRTLRKHPGFTLVALFTLALGIGANSAIFSVVNAVLLKPLPLHEPDRLVNLWESFQPPGGGPAWTGTASVPNLRDWREQNDVLTGIAAYQTASYNLLGGQMPERLQATTVDANFFDIVGMPPLLGRTFRSGEDQAGQHRVVVLSHQLWQQHFAADPNITTRQIVLNNENYSVIGVMPPSFRYPSRLTTLWTPLVIPEQQRNQRGNHYLLCIGRLKPGVAFEQAQAQMTTIARRLEQQYPDNQTGRSILLIPAREQVVRNIRPALLVLLSAVGFVLLIACTNVANLMLVRATARRREIAIRTALGAKRWRVVRQLLTESVLLSVGGGLLGLLLANWGVKALVAMATTILPRANEVQLDGRVTGFTLLLSLLTGVLFGLVPALHSSKPDLQAALKEGGNAGSSAHSHWLRSSLVVAQIACAVILLIGAGLLLKSFVSLQKAESGLQPTNVLTMRVSLPDTKYTTAEAAAAFHQQVLERVAALPGVQSAGVINMLPIQNSGNNGGIQIEGRPPFAPGQAPIAESRAISPDYFQALGIPVSAGRVFNAQDQAGRESVIIINQTLARGQFPNENPLGKRLQAIDGPTWRTIVGVVSDVKQSGLTQAPRNEVYIPTTQATNARHLVQSMSLAVRTTAEPTALTNAIRQAIQAIDPQQPIYQVQTMEEVIAASISNQRLNTLLLALFAGLALLLAALGIYGVMSYTVAQNTRELGIRMALGAQARDVLRLVVGQGLMLTLLGIVVGLGGAFALTRWLESLLFGVPATDPLTFAGVSGVLLVIALLSCLLPALRATKVDPLVALRHE